MADSHFIIRYLIENGISTDPDDGLTPAQKAESRAFQALMEDVLYTAIVCERWYVDENYATLVKEMFSSIPWPIRSVVWGGTLWRRSIGWRRKVSRHWMRVYLCTYFHGDKPSLIDITIGGFLANCLDTKADPYFSDKVMASPVLRSFCHRINAPLFPEYKHLLGELTAGDKPSEEGTAETS
ncbi:hypothetical protein SERLA73DRAFT_73499 [Serpula lacrymans var. lacrymans S7.3]|uniref:Thioredoxin-like fold domain-containing protein n=2 Tax=Serpula lacrymans var. lacrymans TaxID=341189 RepID=F8PYF0_SERL3|nr:uncharacterized protein SERLADRAFT_438121 [Serpula lacrymans var. lacrymans S7.9]EGN98913.1 hypothetical protein SERLA73DRAFT_73499 [Serpula lacrymans var. lacrymans S7.3]EGO24503.1 hypothetical protein SERLADRAFT_438121 [Serpula lacrymans var. lacrymans S7.9]